MDATVSMRLENVHTDEQRDIVGPFEWVQLTHEILRMSPDGDEIAHNINGDWILVEDGSVWTDIIIGPTGY